MDVFFCEKCNYKTTRKLNYDRHISSQKHNDKNKETTKNMYQCIICEKQFITNAGLWKHRQICCQVVAYNEYDDTHHTLKTTGLSTSVDQFELIKNELDNMKKLIMNLKPVENNRIENQIIENNGDTNYNVNLFLNTECGDAMNLIDFVKNIKMGFDDIMKIGELGYVEGISQIMSEKLEECTIFERPMHCFPMKNKNQNEFCVRDKNNWEKKHEVVENIFDKCMYELDTAIHNTKLKIENKTSTRYENIGKQFYSHSGLGHRNEKEQKEILNKISPTIKLTFINKNDKQLEN
jgi:hypothetical protein